MAHSLLLVHGNGGGAFRFARCLPYFELEVSAPTLPGFSPRPPDPSVSSLDDFSGCLLEEVRKMARPRAALGTGIGGSLLLHMLQSHPDEVDLLILHAPVGAYLDRRLFPRLMKLPGVSRAARFLLGLPLLSPLWTRLFFETTLEPEFLEEFFRGYRDCAAFGTMFRLIHHQWWSGLHPVRVPSVLLWGQRERLLSVDQAEAFRAVLPAARVEIVPGWRHFPMIEQPQDFVRRVEQLCRPI